VIGRCEIDTCSMPEETRKTHEDFEALHWSVCWECGDANTKKSNGLRALLV